MEYFDAASRSEFGLTGEKLSEYCHVVEESSDDYLYSVSKREIKNRTDLSSFKPKKELCPLIWDNNKLKSEVRLRLLDIADDFFDTLEVSWVKPKDIILTGSLANYNWSEFSDYDLHILVDFNDVDDRTEFVKDYFDAKKNAWNNEHDELKLKGFTVEVYVQDINEEHDASGIYSLEKNSWIREPEEDNIKAIKLDKFWIKDKCESFMSRIDSLKEKIEETDNPEEQEVFKNKVESLCDKLKNLRTDSLKKYGEMAPGNILYKVLRRTGYLDELFDMKPETYDKMMSLKN